MDPSKFKPDLKGLVNRRHLPRPLLKPCEMAKHTVHMLILRSHSHDPQTYPFTLHLLKRQQKMTQWSTPTLDQRQCLSVFHF